MNRQSRDTGNIYILDKSEGAIMNRQSRDTDNIVHNKQSDKQYKKTQHRSITTCAVHVVNVLHDIRKIYNVITCLLKGVTKPIAH
jgi:hypothetical protein